MNRKDNLVCKVCLCENEFSTGPFESKEVMVTSASVQTRSCIDPLSQMCTNCFEQNEMEIKTETLDIYNSEQVDVKQEMKELDLESNSNCDNIESDPLEHYTTELLYKCDVCQENFDIYKDLENHRKTHKGKRHYKIGLPHIEIIATFFEENPDFGNGNISATNARDTYREMWQKLCKRLNGAGLGDRSVKKWQITWSDYKFGLKKRAADVEKRKREPLSNVDMRLLNILGEKFYKGDKIDENYAQSDLDQASTSTVTIATNPEAVASIPEATSTVTIVTIPAVVTTSTKPSKRKQGEVEDTIRPIKKIKQTSENEETLYKETINILQDVNQNFKEFNSNFSKLNEILQQSTANIAESLAVIASVASHFLK